MIESIGRGVLDSPPEPVIRPTEGRTGWRGMTSLLAIRRDDENHSRGMFCPRFCKFVAPLKNRGRRECRVRAAPAVSCAKNCTMAHTSIQGSGEHSDIPCAMALRRTSCSPRRANSSCHRRLRETSRKLGTSNGCQDHTTWPYAPAFRPARKHHPFGTMLPRLTPKRPSHPSPTFRDDREAPLMRAGTGRYIVLICRNEKQNIFALGA